MSHEVDAPPKTIRLRVLGQVDLCDATGASLSSILAQPKRLALLAYLATHSGFHRRDTLLGLLWPETDLARGRSSLNQALAFLRNNLGSASIVVSRGADEVGVDANQLWCDALAFRDAVRNEAFEAALELYRDHFLRGVFIENAPGFEEWMERERSALRAIAADAAGKLAKRNERDERLGAAIANARLAVDLADSDERTVRELIALLGRLGDRAGALHAYEAFARKLERDFEAEPSAETRELIARIADGSDGSVSRSVLVKRDGLSQSRHTEPLDAIHLTVAPTPARRVVTSPKLAAIAVGGAAVIAAMWLPRASDSLRLGQTFPVTREPGVEFDPALSFDGRMVAYAALDSASEQPRIFVRSVAGGPPVCVSCALPGAHVLPHWSRDMSQILFTSLSKRVEIYQVPSLGGAPRLLVEDGGWGALSPDGSVIAYGKDKQLFVRSSNGIARRIASATAPVHSIEWSPDGRWIAFVSGNVEWISPTAFYNIGPSEIELVDARGGEPIRLTGDAQLNTSPTWFPDSRSLLFVSNREGRADVYRARIGPSGSLSGTPRRVTTDLGVGTIALSGDGTKLVYSLVQSNEANVWRIPISDGPPLMIDAAQRVTSGNQHIEAMSVSPDSQWIAFDSDRSGNADIYKMRMSGGEPIPLTTDPHDDFYPAWSPDGRWIAFISWRSGTRDIYVTSSSGSEPERLVVGSVAQEFRPAWSPDSRRLVFLRDSGGIAAINLVERADDGHWLAPKYLAPGRGYPKFSPDGKRVLFHRFPTDSVRTGGVYTIGVDGSDERLVMPWPIKYAGITYPNSGAAEWSADGESIYLKTGYLFWSVPSHGNGSPRPLVAYSGGDVKSPRAEFVRAGGHLYFTVAQRESDLRIALLER